MTQTLGRFRQLALGAVAASGLLAGVLPAQQPTRAIRSTAEVRPRLIDEHDRPYVRQTQSHRGFEVREAQFTVVATTSPDDARWAAGHVAAAWSNASQLAGRWTQVAENPDFGLNSLQVVIDNEPLRERDGPATTVNVVGIQTQVVIRVGPGQPPLAAQVVRLREAAALAQLHTAGLDSAAPPWVVAGLAAHAGRKGLSEAELKAAAANPPAEQLGGQQWRFARASQDALAYQRLDQAAANAQVEFLLTAHDAQHAPALLAALRDTTTSAADAAARGGGFRNLPGDPQLPPAGTSFDRLIAGRQEQFQQWQSDPQIGQPVVEPAADATPEVLAAQAEMLVLLKLHRRLSSATAGKQERVGPRVKVVTFKEEPAKAAAPDSSPAIASFAELAARLRDPSQQVWATLDADGALLLSTDAQRVNQLLANDSPRYRLESSDRGMELVRTLDGGRELRGWLAQSAEHKSRPLAKFESVSKPLPRKR
jgi:hypothetical protein